MKNTAVIVAHEPQESGYYLLRLHAPELITQVQIGQQLQLSYEQTLFPLLPIGRLHPHQGWIDIFYPETPHIALITQLRQLPISSSLHCTRITGTALHWQTDAPCLIMAEEHALGSIMGIAAQLKQQKHRTNLTLLTLTDTPPFTPCPSRLIVPSLPVDAIAALPLLEDWQLASRLVHSDAVGCFSGEIQQLAAQWLDNLAAPNTCQILALGSATFLAACQQTANIYQCSYQCMLIDFALNPVEELT